MNNFSASGTLRLGTLQKEYGCARKFVWSSLVFGPLLVLVAFALAALPVWWLISDAKIENPALTLSLMEFAALVSFALGVVVLVKLYMYRNMRVQIFERGLAYLTGGRMQTFAWDEVESYRAESTRIYINGIPSGTTHKHTLQKANGERLVLSQRTAGIEEVADRIARETFRHQLPRALDTLRGGSHIWFGKFAVTPQGLWRGKKFLAWSEINSVDVKAGTITIRQHGKWLAWANAAYKTVPNAAVFLALVDTMLAPPSAR